MSTAQTDTSRITSRHSRHGHRFAVTIRFADDSDAWVDLETGATTAPGGRVLAPITGDELAALRTTVHWREPISYVDVIDPETGEWTVKAEPCAGCEQLKRRSR